MTQYDKFGFPMIPERVWFGDAAHRSYMKWWHQRRTIAAIEQKEMMEV